MSSTSNFISRGLLMAGAIALPLVSGTAFAQSTTPAAPANPSAATPSASATGTSATGTSTDKQMGALKATPADKKAAHDKKTPGPTAQKASGTKASTTVKKQAVDTKTTPAGQTAKPASGTSTTP